MKPVFRLTAAALAAIIALTASVQSQDPGQQPEAAAAARHEYDLRDLTTDDLTAAGAPPSAIDVLAPDRAFGRVAERAEDQWSLRASGHEARCWEDSDSALKAIAEFCAFPDDQWDVSTPDLEQGRHVLVASQEMHKRVKWALAAIRQVARARVSLRVVRLPETDVALNPCLSAKDTAAVLARGRIMGAGVAGLGDSIVLQQTATTSYVADYDTSTATSSGGHTPVSRTLLTGEEITAGAILLADGRVWVQGWRTARKTEEMRKLATCAGDVELPSVAFGYMPVSATIENGGAALIDAGPAGRFALCVTITGAVNNAALDCGNGRELRLYNTVGVIRGFGLATRWLMTPNTTEALDDAALAQVILGEGRIDGPYNDAALRMKARFYSMGAAGDCDAIGPLFGVRMAALEEGDADSQRARKTMLEALDATARGREAVSVRIRAFRVGGDAKLPSGVLLGSPSLEAIAQVATTPGASPIIDRISAAGSEQNVDLLDIRVMAHVRAYEMSTATGISLHDPQVRSLLLGTQLRWASRKNADGGATFDVRAGVTVGSDKFEAVEVTLAGKPFSVERSRSNLAQAAFSADLDPGHSCAHVCPASGGQDALLVFVVTRLK